MTRHDAAPYDLFMLGLSVYVLGALSAQTLFRLDAETLVILDIADFAVCLVFGLDFLRSLARAEDRLRYFITWGWLDLLSSLPTLDVCRWGRVARIFRIIRLLRGAKATRILATFALRRKAESAFWGTALVAILMTVFSSIGIVQLERAAGGNISGGADALWWALATVTTVGYGDLYPITDAGRILAACLMLVGIGVFGTFTAYLASSFLAPEELEQNRELADLARQVAELEKLQRDRRDT